MSDADLDDDSRQELVTAAYARLISAPRPGVFTEQATFWNRPQREAAMLAMGAEEDGRPAATWWPILLIGLLCAIAGVALFG